MTSPPDPWPRIAAESELRPRRGPIQDVPGDAAAPEPAPMPKGPPIRLGEVPGAAPAAPRGSAPAHDPVSEVPYTAPAQEPDPVELVETNPYPMAPAPQEGPPPPLITAVPAPEVATAPLVDIPEAAAAEPATTSWWRLMLGKGKPARDTDVASRPKVVDQPKRPVM